MPAHFDNRWRRGPLGSRPRRHGRLAGCLLWLLGLIIVLVILSLLFGGFQKGTKAGSLGHSCASCTSAPIAAGRLG
jgi:hypothetical protein